MVRARRFEWFQFPFSRLHREDRKSFAFKISDSDIVSSEERTVPVPVPALVLQKRFRLLRFSQRRF